MVSCKEALHLCYHSSSKPGAKDKGFMVLARLRSPAHTYTVFEDLVTEWHTCYLGKAEGGVQTDGVKTIFGSTNEYVPYEVDVLVRWTIPLIHCTITMRVA